MSMNVLAIFLFIKVLEIFRVVYRMFWIELFLAYRRTFGIFLIRAGMRAGSGSISSNVQNDLERSLIVKGKIFA